MIFWVYALLRFLIVAASTTQRPKRVDIQQPINPTIDPSPATVQSKMEETFIAPTVTFVDEKSSSLAEIISLGTVDQLDDFIESRGGYAEYSGRDINLLYYAAVHQKLDIFIHLLEKGFSVDSIIPGLNMPVYRFIITMKSTPIRDAMLRIAYETSDRMLEDYYRPMFKKTGWDVDAAEAMRLNDFIYIDRILNRHKAHPHNVITNQGLMLHSAILNDCPECVRLILKAGADPNHPYVGTALLKGNKSGEEGEWTQKWTPLMMAVAKGDMRVIDALLESPKIQVCTGPAGPSMKIARSLARKWPRSQEKFELLKKLHARKDDSPILSSWIKGIALAHLNMKFALQRREVKYVEFLLHNCVQDIDPEWIKYAMTNSSAECLGILLEEYPHPIDNLKLRPLIGLETFERNEKIKLIRGS